MVIAPLPACPSCRASMVEDAPFFACEACGLRIITPPERLQDPELVRSIVLAKIEADAMRAASAQPPRTRWHLIARLFVALYRAKIVKRFGWHEDIARHRGTIAGLVFRMEEQIRADEAPHEHDDEGPR